MTGALLIVRLYFGLGIAAHGAQKLFGWFKGRGIAGTGAFFDQMGLRPGRLLAFAAGVGEFGGGVLIASGLFGPVGPALVFLVMTVAAVIVHAHNGFFVSGNGVEVPFLYAAGVFLLAYTGPGAFSLDTLLGLQSLSTPVNASIALAVGLAIALANIALRREPLGKP
jgi:putative oxidoreductase